MLPWSSQEVLSRQNKRSTLGLGLGIASRLCWWSPTVATLYSTQTQIDVQAVNPRQATFRNRSRCLSQAAAILVHCALGFAKASKQEPKLLVRDMTCASKAGVKSVAEQWRWKNETRGESERERERDKQRERET